MTESGQPVALHLLRHAHAGDAETWDGDDDVRPLSEKGVRQAERLGLHLALAGFKPDLILTSPKLRASQTADLVGAAIGKPVTIDERLGRPFGLSALAKLLGDYATARQPVLVGHDPDFSELLTML